MPKKTKKNPASTICHEQFQPVIDASIALLDGGDISLMEVIIEAIERDPEGLKEVIRQAGDDLVEWPMEPLVFCEALSDAGVGRAPDGRYFLPIFSMVFAATHAEPVQPCPPQVLGYDLTLDDLTLEELGLDFTIHWFRGLHSPDSPACRLSPSDLAEFIEPGSPRPLPGTSPNDLERLLQPVSVATGLIACGALIFDKVTQELVHALVDESPQIRSASAEFFHENLCEELSGYADVCIVGRPVTRPLLPADIGRTVTLFHCVSSIRSFACNHDLHECDLEVRDITVETVDGLPVVSLFVSVEGEPQDQVHCLLSSPPRAHFPCRDLYIHPEEIEYGLLLWVGAEICSVPDEMSADEILPLHAARLARGYPSQPEIKVLVSRLLWEVFCFVDTGDAEALFDALCTASRLSPEILDELEGSIREFSQGMASVLGRLSLAMGRVEDDVDYDTLLLPVMIPISLIDSPDRTGPMLRYADLGALSAAISNASDIEVAFINHIYHHRELLGGGCMHHFLDHLYELADGRCEFEPECLRQSGAWYGRGGELIESEVDTFIVVGLLRAPDPSETLVNLVMNPLAVDFDDMLDSVGVTAALDRFREEAFAPGVTSIVHPMMPVSFGIQAGQLFQQTIRAATDACAYLPGSGGAHLFALNLSPSATEETGFSVHAEIGKEAGSCYPVTLSCGFLAPNATNPYKIKSAIARTLGRAGVAVEDSL